MFSDEKLAIEPLSTVPCPAVDFTGIVCRPTGLEYDSDEEEEQYSYERFMNFEDDFS